MTSRKESDMKSARELARTLDVDLSTSSTSRKIHTARNIDAHFRKKESDTGKERVAEMSSKTQMRKTVGGKPKSAGRRKSRKIKRTRKNKKLIYSIFYGAVRK
jgi:hypothetical protein